MQKQLNYPVKYAVLELKEKGGYLVGYKDITNGFIASKCYVVGTDIKYYSDGAFKISHRVVFPYDDISVFKSALQNGRINLGELHLPHYDACNKPNPIWIVDHIHDTYEEAKSAAEEKNEEYKENLIMEVPMQRDAQLRECITSVSNWKKQYEVLTKEFEKKLEICNLFEEKVLTQTQDMEVSISKEAEVKHVKVLTPVDKKEK